MRHFSKALVYNSGNRQQLPGTRVVYIHSLEQRNVNQYRKCVYGGDQVRDLLSFYIKSMRFFILLRESENNCAPGVLPFSLAVDSLAKPCKLHPTQNSILLAGIVHPRIATGKLSEYRAWNATE
jgi:hypothetical protein